jgi:ubiquinone/menaquinone biosynthesis C-methylase UbiE
MNDQSQFWNNVATKYSKKSVPSQENYEIKLKLTRELLNENMKVLEIGCGTGTTALIHAPFVSKIIATDFSQKMIEIAKEKSLTQEVSNIEFKREAVEEMNYPKDEFDVIMAHSILHLVENKEEVLKKIYSSLRPGGYFVTSTGCISGFYRLLKPLWFLVHKLNKLPYLSFFSKEDFIREVSNCGFQLETRLDPTSVDIFLIGKKL